MIQLMFDDNHETALLVKHSLILEEFVLYRKVEPDKEEALAEAVEWLIDVAERGRS